MTPRPLAPVLCIGILLVPLALHATPSDRSARRILGEFDGIEMPGMQPEGMSVEEYEALLGAGCQKQMDLAWELYQTHPRHRRVPELLRIRWLVWTNFFKQPAQVIEETNRMLSDRPRRAIRDAALLTRGWAAVQDRTTPLERSREYVNAAASVRTRGGDNHEIVAGILSDFALSRVHDPEEQISIYERIRDDYGKTQASYEARGQLGLRKRARTRLDLDSHDALTGAPLRLKDFRGAPVVLVVWDRGWKHAPPAEWPAELAEAHRSGLAVVGVFQSMTGKDDREAVVGLARERGMEWPQHVEPEKRFDETWAWTLGVRRVPFFLLLDREGELDLASSRATPIVTRARALGREASF